MTATPPLVPRADWDPWFDRARPSPFAPLCRAMARFRGFAAWPRPADWNAALADASDLHAARGQAICFVLQAPRPSRARRRTAAAVTHDGTYDGQIYTRGEVPSRADNWHDFFNMLVWASFPRAKRAVNARQYAAASVHFAAAPAPAGDELVRGGVPRSVPAGAARTRLPGARTREQDALAMLDEGGLLLLCRDAAAARTAERALASDRPGAALGAEAASRAVVPLVFGHALYEHLVSSAAPVRACVAFVVADQALPTDPDAARAMADTALAARLADATFVATPAALGSVVLTDALFAVPPTG